jgi:anti-sigma regulatory factor (Ser/Thr protein kinase)
MKILSEIKLPAKLENLGSLLQSIMSTAGQEGFSGPKLNHIEITAEEAIVNVFNYAYPEGNGDVEVRCKEDDDSFIIEIVDSGVPFDVTSLAEPDTTATLSEREIGGLGIFFMKKMMDDVRYSRENGRNVLCLVLNRKGKGGSSAGQV